MNLEFDALISSLNEALVETYSDDRELFGKLIAVQSELGLLYGDRPTCPLLRPHFMPRALYRSIVTAAENIVAAAEIVTSAALQDPHLLSRFNLTELENELVKYEQGYSVTSISSRLDTFVSGEEFKFLEYNAETPAGVGDQMQIEVVLNRIPLIREFLSKHPHWTPKPHQKLLRALFDSYREYGGKKSKPNIAIVDWEGVSTEPEFYSLKDYFESCGFKTLIADPGELEYNGKTLVAGSFEIDIVYKRVLIHEFLEKFGLKHPLVDAYTDHNVCMANSFRVKIPHKKALFSVLSGERFEHLFTKSQLAAIKTHIPWTRNVEECTTHFKGKEVDLIGFINKNRDSFLIKPNDDYGGHGIVLGWESSDSDWEAKIAEALKEPYVVQERAPVTKQEFPVFSETAYLQNLLVDFDPFLFRNQVEGGMVRLSSAALVNVSQGGGQTAFIVLE
jgi:uncharacterized circularly permuted ATP-grasp superfamily protein